MWKWGYWHTKRRLRQEWGGWWGDDDEGREEKKTQVKVLFVLKCILTTKCMMIKKKSHQPNQIFPYFPPHVPHTLTSEGIKLLVGTNWCALHPELVQGNAHQLLFALTWKICVVNCQIRRARDACLHGKFKSWEKSKVFEYTHGFQQHAGEKEENLQQHIR